MSPLTIGSLFSGYGGLDLAVEAVTGARTAWHCEYDDAPARILAHHYPDIPNHHDVTQINWDVVEPVDIITGGSPCQDLSAAGKRAGMTQGARSNLWVNMREAIAALRPRLVVWENVRGALSATATSDSDMEPGSGPLGTRVGGHGHLRALGRVLGDLAELGYDAQWTLVRASDVGAPHHRARVFLIAYPADADGLRWGPGEEQSRAGSQKVPAVVRDDCAFPDDLTHLPTPNASDGSGGGQTADKRVGHSRQLIDAVLDLDQPYLPTPTTTQRGPDQNLDNREGARANLHNCVIEQGSLFGKYAPVVHRWEEVLGRPAPTPTELNKNGRPRLNAAFAEFMMGLPAGWVTDAPGVTRAQQLKAIGNGVCPQQAAAALTHLLTEAP